MFRRYPIVLAMAMLLIVGVWASALAQTEEGDEADIAAIEEVWNQYAATTRAGDVETWISLWTDDAIKMKPNAPAVGKEAMRAGKHNAVDHYIFDPYYVTPEEIRVAGDWAFTRGAYGFTKTPKEEGQAVQGVGKFLDILRRQADGSWKIAIDCYNYDGPIQPVSKVVGTSWGLGLSKLAQDVEADIAAVKGCMTDMPQR